MTTTAGTVYTIYGIMRIQLRTTDHRYIVPCWSMYTTNTALIILSLLMSSITRLTCDPVCFHMLQYLSYKNLGSQTYLKTAGSIEAVLGFFSLYFFRRARISLFSPGAEGRLKWKYISLVYCRLDITFPASYSPNSYGLPMDDYTVLFTEQHLNNLKQ